MCGTSLAKLLSIEEGRRLEEVHREPEFCCANAVCWNRHPFLRVKVAINVSKSQSGLSRFMEGIRDESRAQQEGGKSKSPGTRQS